MSAACEWCLAMDEVIRHIGNIYSMDRATLGVICVLCGIAAFFLKDYMASPIFVIFAYPVLFIISVVIQYLFILGEIYPPRKLDQSLMWTIMASICGNILGIALVAWFSRVREALISAPRRR